MTKIKTKIKWYNDPQMVGSFLLFLPPVGLYGIYKSETIAQKWKRITSGTLAIVGILLALNFLL